MGDRILSARSKPGVPIPPQELGGLLNSSVAKSVEDQRARGIQLRAMLYGIVGQEGLPPAERHARLEQIATVLGPRFFVPEQASTPQEIKDLHAQTATGHHPLTREGLMLYPKAGGDPLKLKNTAEHDVILRALFPGKNRLAGTHAGGFSYSSEPDGPILGEVGGGLSDETRQAMHERPEDFIGRTARVRAQKVMPSGALYAPSFLALHEDIPAVVSS